MREYNYNEFIKKYNLNRVDTEINPSFGTQYIVETDDNLYNIAHRFNTTVQNLIKLNNLNSDVVYPGEIIMVDDLYTPGRPSIYKKYTVKKDDTIYNIAYNFSMTVRELRILNDLISNEVVPGQILTVNNIPGLLSANKVYTTEKGDSLYSIAKKFNITVNELKSANKLKNNLLHIGVELIIPEDKKDSLYQRYIVLPGDTLYSISKRQNAIIGKIKEINNLDNDELYIGQELLLPIKI